MAKITTIIDIGSNSMRMVVFKKTSRFAFHLINETKSKVKISQDSYQNGSYLQEDAMNRGFLALESFLNISTSLKSNKILIVATSALRDAPNSNVFISRVKKDLKLNIKIIDGKKEALLGGIAAQNLLSFDNFTTVDIGGGSTEFALIQNNTIVDTISLNIGTVRLEELFFKNNDYTGAKQYILNQLENLPIEFKNIQSIAGMGGTIRSLSRLIIEKSNHPIDTLHNFTYQVKDNIQFLKSILDAKSNKELKQLGIRKDRYDTIQAGTCIFITILEYLNTSTVVTSGAGVREGLYLSDILRTSASKFPANFNVSLRSLLDRFTDDKKQTAYMGNNISKIFDTLKPLHNLDDSYKSPLIIAAKLQQIGISLSFYKNKTHSSNFILDGLNYGFTHEQRVLIAKIIKYSKKELPSKNDLIRFENLLPDLLTMQWLTYMHNLNKILNSEFLCYKFEYSLEENDFIIKSNKEHYIIQRAFKKLEHPLNFNQILLKV